MNAILFLFLWHLAPLQGLATWYGPPQFNDGDIMRNGEALQLSAHTVAVDASHVDWLDRNAVVLTECGGVHFVRVTDIGPFYKAGYFRLGIGPMDQLRYWPVNTSTIRYIKWKEDKALRVIADFPRDFFLNEISCSGDETVKVKIYVGTHPLDDSLPPISR